MEALTRAGEGLGAVLGKDGGSKFSIYRNFGDAFPKNGWHSSFCS